MLWNLALKWIDKSESPMKQDKNIVIPRRFINPEKL